MRTVVAPAERCCFFRRPAFFRRRDHAGADEFKRLVKAAGMSVSIPRRPLGKTGLEVSVLGYGASALGAVFEETLDVEEGIASVHEALNLGINFFDTSPYYGITKSEKVLGQALASVPRSSYILSTKAGRYGPEEFDFSAERVTNSIQESLERLGVEYFDMVHCHDIEFTNLDQIVSETLPALVKLKEKGFVRNIGIAGLPLKVFHYVLDRTEPGIVDLVLTYCHHTLFDNTLLNSLPYFLSKGVGVINAAPLSMGLLSPQGPPPWHPASPEVKTACRKAASICESVGVSLPSLSLQHSTSCLDVSTTLTSMPTRHQVQENVKSVVRGLKIDTSDKGLLEKEEKCLADLQPLFSGIDHVSWSSGLPENN